MKSKDYLTTRKPVLNITLSIGLAAGICLIATGSMAQPTTDKNVVLERQEIATEESIASACAGSRPKPIGCRYIGKPCIQFVCIDGKWEPVSIETDFPNRPGETKPTIPCEFLEKGCSPLPRR